MTKLFALILILLALLPTALRCATVSEIYLNPGYIGLNPYAQHQFRVMGLDASGADVPVTEAVTWRMLNNSAGTISPTGLFTAGTSDSYYVAALQATLPSGLSAVANIEVHTGSMTPSFQWDKTWGNEAPGQLCNASGIARDSFGHFIVADSNNGRLQEFDAGGHFIRQIGSFGTQSGQFNQPTGLAIDASDDIYVADCWNSRIQKLSHSGQVLAVWGSAGGGNGQFSFPGSVGLDGSGHVFVIEGSGGNCRVQKLDASGNLIKSWGGWGSGNGMFEYPTDIAVDSQGNVYVCDGNYPQSPTFSRIQKFTNDGVFIKSWGVFSNGPGRLMNPSAIATDSADRVYVANTDFYRIQRFDSDGAFQWEFTYSPSIETQIPDVRSFLVDSVTGDLSVLSKDTVRRFSSVGTYLGHWNNTGRAGQWRADQWSWRLPVMATHSTNPSIIVNTFGDGGQIFDGNCQWQGNLPGVTLDNVSDYIFGVFPWPNGDIGALDCHCRLLKIGVDGKASVVRALTGVTLDNTASSVVVGRDGTTYMVYGPRIWKFDPAGSFSTRWPLHSGATEIWDLAVDPAGNVYALDGLGGAVEKFDSLGHFLGNVGSTGQGPGQFGDPEAIAVDEDGNLYVADGCGRVYKFDTDGKFVLYVGGTGIESLGYPTGLALDPAGNLYVCDWSRQRLTKFAAPSPSVAAVRSKPDGARVFLSNQIVSAGSNDLYDCFYIESADRAAGIKVISPAFTYTDDRTIVTGLMTTSGGERAIQSIDAYTTGCGTSIAPLAMSCAAIGGGAMFGQPTLWGSRWIFYSDRDPERLWSELSGLNTTGLLVKTWGRVVSRDEDQWVIGISDGFGPDQSTIRCFPMNTWPLPQIGDFVMVTGVSTVMIDDGYPVPLLRTRTESDLQVLQP